jgi:hypothetical protein
MALAQKLADAGSNDLADIVDLDSYPIHEPNSQKLQDIIARTREQLDDVGCSVLPQFLRADALERARREGVELSPKTTYSHTRTNPYFTADDPSLPEDDPRRFFMERTSGFITRDMLPPDTVIQRLYVAPGMKDFVAACVREPEVYEYADPFAGLVVNVLPPGTEQPWHYDTNEFITTIMTQEPEAGGIFEYVPNARTPQSENLDSVASVLHGTDRSEVRQLDLRPGDLQLFKGRFSLHRVSEVRGARERHTAILAYAEQPGVVGRAERTRQLYGRVAEAHLQAERRQTRSDGLTD